MYKYPLFLPLIYLRNRSFRKHQGSIYPLQIRNNALRGRGAYEMDRFVNPWNVNLSMGEGWARWARKNISIRIYETLIIS